MPRRHELAREVGVMLDSASDLPTSVGIQIKKPDEYYCEFRKHKSPPATTR
jgi:hypothetical protein